MNAKPTGTDRSHPTNKVLILCDFDGTVSTKDTVSRLLREHVRSSELRFHVKRYMRGEIGSKAVYEAVAPLMRMKPGDIEEFVRGNAALDPQFPAFLRWAGELDIDVKIVSDGFDLTIVTLLADHGIEAPEIFANRLILDEGDRVRIRSPFSDTECGWCGTCKHRLVRGYRGEYDAVILIGDGESDRHAAQEADAVLALEDLFIYCAREGIPAVRIDGFKDVPRILTTRIDAVAFDLDGTLVDSIGSITEAFNHMFVQLGYPTMTVDEVARKTSVSLKDFVHGFLRPEEVERGIKIFRDHYDEIYLEKTTVIPGAKETLDALDDSVLTGIVTNKRGWYARKLAEHLGISKGMARIIGAEDGFLSKPAPDMFEEFMRSVNADPERTVYVGDSPIDIEAARSAGIDAIAIGGPIFPPEELALHGPRRVLPRINELPSAIPPLIRTTNSEEIPDLG
jgi:2,3-diketo-5-methylthio-1-phosphopentane phosphatase/HAD superfamily hydrolase (TIGR01509 family)